MAGSNEERGGTDGEDVVINAFNLGHVVVVSLETVRCLQFHDLA